MFLLCFINPPLRKVEPNPLLGKVEQNIVDSCNKIITISGERFCSTFSNRRWALPKSGFGSTFPKGGLDLYI
jgi:hypothetical protein